MTPETTEAGPRQPGSAPKIAAATKLQDHTDPTAGVASAVVFGTRLLAAGDACYDRILVRRCCWCGHAHLHIAFEGRKASIERAPSCAKHRTYVVEIVDVVPTAAERMQRGAA